MLKTTFKILCVAACLMLLMFCTKEPEVEIGRNTVFSCSSPLTICSKPDSIGQAFGAMDCDGGGISNVLECRNGTDFKDGDDDCAAAVRGKIDICLLIRTDASGNVGDLNDNHILANQDCDGGGLTNIEECFKGFNPIKGNDSDELYGSINDSTMQAFLIENEYVEDTIKLADTLGIIGINADSTEVIYTESGLVYFNEKLGFGDIPTSEDTINYRFISSYISVDCSCTKQFECATSKCLSVDFNPIEITPQTSETALVKDLIFGIQEWLKISPVGTKAKLIIPARLAYNQLSFVYDEINSKTIPEYSVIVMDIELLSIL